ncbi:hypothetical protein EW146_g5448, partial [Bondarzewia mesenterica]
MSTRPTTPTLPSDTSPGEPLRPNDVLCNALSPIYSSPLSTPDRSPSPPVLALPPASFGLHPASGPVRRDKRRRDTSSDAVRFKLEIQPSVSVRKRDRQYRCP